MIIDPAQLAPDDAYQLLLSTVIPRPIGWVSSVDESGRANLAPFSFFGAVTSSPMTVMLSVGRRGGKSKDTGRNLRATGEAVIHIPTRQQAQRMVATSGEYPPETDEFQACDLAKAKTELVRPPRVADAAIAMEARVVQHQEVGSAPMDMFLLEVVRLHLADGVLSNGRVDPAKCRVVGRMGGSSYCETEQTFKIARPEI